MTTKTIIFNDENKFNFHHKDDDDDENSTIFVDETKTKSKIHLTDKDDD